ncbi:MAG TPA: TIGR01777 family oxidoreductase [Rhizomicrobium sp.]|jgi:hypothetical protein
MSPLLQVLIVVQIAMGAFDTFYHHELTECLAWRPSQKGELKLHGARNLIYALVFAVLGWTEIHGLWAWLLIAALSVEIVVTLIDFVEEDATRRLPASERVTHTLLALNYGVICALLMPVLLGWAAQPIAILPVTRGLFSLLAAAATLGTIVTGLRDLAAARRLARIQPNDAAGLVAALRSRRTVLVTGATGFIGSRLVEALSAAGHHVIVLVRDPHKAEALRPPYTLITSLDQIAGDAAIDAIVNLAGEPIANGLWTNAKRKRIVDSRVQITSDVGRLIDGLKRRPSVLINGSAIGWYGLRSDEMLTETSTGTPCFSRTICEAWEAEARKAQGLRVVLLRIGLVMGSTGGLLQRLLTPFEYGMGGRIGSGAQWMSWIERDDLIRLIAHAIATPSLSGAVNATAPEPVRNRDFAKHLGHALHRPSFMPLPAAPLHLLLGAFAEELFLCGQRVLPRKALASGFHFRHETLDSALAAIVGGNTKLPVIPGEHRAVSAM